VKHYPVKKNRVIATILLIFSVMFIAFVLTYYRHTYQDIKLFKVNTQQSVEKLYEDISKQMFHKQLEYRSQIILKGVDSKAKIEAIKEHNQTQIAQLFKIDYKNLKDQIKGFEIMHFYDTNGISIFRMHNPSHYGDDLTRFRECVRAIVDTQKTTSFFEVGIHGLAYRYTTPIYDKKELIGYIELGIKPLMLFERLYSVFGLKGHVYLENQYIPKEIQGNLYRINAKYSICKFCTTPDHRFLKNIQKLNINNDHFFEIQKKSYSVIKKDIHDAKGSRIGSIVFFQDISMFQHRIKDFIVKSTLLFLIALLLSYFALNTYITIIFMRLNRAKFLLDNVTDAVYVVRLEDGSIVDVNERASLMLGFSRQELLSKKIMEIRQPMPEDESLDWQEHATRLKRKKFLASRGIDIRKDGTSFPIEANLSYIDDNGDESMISVTRDITHRLTMEQKIAKETNELKRLQDVISQSVLYTTSDLNGRITSVSKAFEEFCGYPEAQLIGKNHSIFKDPATPKGFYRNMWRILLENKTFVGEIKNYSKEGKKQWLKITISPMFQENGLKVGYSSYRENITDKKELEYISTHDTLTGVHNREYFQQALNKKINVAVRENHSFGFIMLDIDHFKSVNDTYGHAVGDSVLKKAAEAVSKQIGVHDAFARWGGEEFIIMTPHSTIKEMKVLIFAIQNAIAKSSFEPVPNITVSFGMTLYRAGDSAASIQKRADDALYKAKANGRNCYEVEL